MSTIEFYRKQAKLLARWHSERNYSVGGKLRMIERYSHLTDVQALDMDLPLTLAQEAVAVEAGFASWEELRRNLHEATPPSYEAAGEVALSPAVPILFVQNVTTAAAFYRATLGFQIDFLHGEPPFYGSVSRGAARLHLRFVRKPNFFELAEREDSLILTTIEVSNVKALFDEFRAADVDFAQKLKRQAWGGIDFQVCDPDRNVISFVQYPDGAADR